MEVEIDTLSRCLCHSLGIPNPSVVDLLIPMASDTELTHCDPPTL